MAKNCLALRTVRKSVPEIELMIPVRFQGLRIQTKQYDRVVVSGQDELTAQPVVIYKLEVRNDPTDMSNVFKELLLRKRINHPNNLNTVYSYTPQEDVRDFKDIYFVTETLETNLYFQIAAEPLVRHEQISYVIYQMLTYLTYLHDDVDFILGPLSTADLCVDTDILQLKVDVSKVASKGQPGYIAPEHILGILGKAKRGRRKTVADIDQLAGDNKRGKKLNSAQNVKYERRAKTVVFRRKSSDLSQNLTSFISRSISEEFGVEEELFKMSDIWTVACVMVEMIVGHPLFTDSSTSEQNHLACLKDICRCLGLVPEYMCCNDNDLFKQVRSFSNSRTKAEIFYSAMFSKRNRMSENPTSPQFREMAVDFLSKSLRIDPKERWPARDLLKHPYINIWKLEGRHLTAHDSEMSPCAYKTGGQVTLADFERQTSYFEGLVKNNDQRWREILFTELKECQEMHPAAVDPLKLLCIQKLSNLVEWDDMGQLPLPNSLMVELRVHKIKRVF